MTGATGPHAVTHAIALDRPDAADAIRAYARDGVDRIIEVNNHTLITLRNDEARTAAGHSGNNGSG